MSEAIRFPTKLQPLFRPARYKILYGGRGAAKSWGVARALLLLGWQMQIRILCAREIQRTISDSVHRLLADQIYAMGLDGFYKITETEIAGANGTNFAFAGLRQQDVGKIKSFEGVDRCWVEEAQTVTKKSWDILIPTIRKDGSEIWATFNPELDTDETYMRFVVNPPPGAVVIKINWQDNPWFPETLRKEKDHLFKTDKEAYENVWEGKCRSTVEGAIYKREIEQLVEQKRLRNVPYDPMLKVHTVWDLGFVRMPVTLVQRQGPELRIIEYIENEAADYGGVVAELSKRKYNWGTDYLPHDAGTHSPHTGKTPEQIVKALGRRVELVPKLDVEQGIKAARMIFPRMYIDKDNAGLLFERLKRYRRAINQTTNEPGPPLHDENSDGADTVRYLGVVADKLKNDDLGWNKPIKYPNHGRV